MNLNNFENYINGIIFQRGYDYYKNDYVISIEETEVNVYEAEVEGSEIYTVEVELDEKSNIIDTKCDCPYDMGEYCKHQVAVFLTLKDLKNNIAHKKDANTESKLGLTNSPIRKVSDIKQILSKRNKDELIAFILKISSEYKEIKQRILLEFNTGSEVDEISEAISTIRTFIRKNSDRGGFINYRDTYTAVKGAELVLDKAYSAYEQSKLIHAIKLALCVVREMVEVIQNADDSDGIIGGIIEQSLDFIYSTIEENELSLLDKDKVFQYLIQEASNNLYDGWTDWRLNLLEICSILADTPELRNKLESYLELMIKNEEKNSWSRDYLAERVCFIKYNLTLKQDGQKKAEEFIEHNLNYSGFREIAIQSAMSKKDYNRVVKLTLEGEEKDKDYMGLVHRWREYRYKAFQHLGKLDEQRSIAMYFILEGDFDYYKELKSTYNLKEWASVYPQIILKLENQKKTCGNIYTCILIEEGEKPKLLEYIKKRPSLVEDYYKYLISEYKEEVYEIFIRYIEETAARAGNRRDYQRVCAIIQNLKKAGGKEQATQIKQKLSNLYIKRPAFQDELSRV